MLARFDPLSKRPLGIKKWNCPSVLLPLLPLPLLPHSFLSWQVPSFVASLLFLCRLSSCGRCSNVYSTHECLYFRMNHLPLLRINSMLSFPFFQLAFFCALEPHSRPTISCVSVALLFYELFVVRRRHFGGFNNEIPSILWPELVFWPVGFEHLLFACKLGSSSLPAHLFSCSAVWLCVNYDK